MKTELLQIRLTKELKEQLKELAAAENRTATNYIETLIKREIKKRRGCRTKAATPFFTCFSFGWRPNH